MTLKFAATPVQWTLPQSCEAFPVTPRLTFNVHCIFWSAELTCVPRQTVYPKYEASEQFEEASPIIFASSANKPSVAYLPITTLRVSNPLPAVELQVFALIELSQEAVLNKSSSLVGPLPNWKSLSIWFKLSSCWPSLVSRPIHLRKVSKFLPAKPSFKTYPFAKGIEVVSQA